MPIDIASLRARLDDAIVTARQDAKDSISIAPNSYGTGYDTGYLDALLCVLNTLNDEPNNCLPELTLTFGECDCCGKVRVLHNIVAYGIEISACTICRGGNLSDDIDDLEDEIERVKNNPDCQAYYYALLAALREIP